MKKKLITKKAFKEMEKYHNQMGGYDFENAIGDYCLKIECHHRYGNLITLHDEERDLKEKISFSFNNLTYEKLEEYIENLKQKIS
jgi:hypothetical protein